METLQKENIITDSDKRKVDAIPLNPKYTDTITTINGKSGELKKSNEMYEPKFIIDKFFENYHRIILESYFKNRDIVDLEREIKSKSIHLYNLFSKFQSYEIDSLNEDFPVISYALEGYIVNELMILQNLYMTLNAINSIYFTDNQHE